MKLPDAFILATGEALGARAVLTADADWPRYSSLARVLTA
jgi:hypothetical protein